MNFVNRRIGEPWNDFVRVHSQSPIPVERNWLVRYDSIEFVALCADVGTVLIAGLFSGLVSQDSWTVGHIARTCGYATIVSLLFVYVLKNRGLYRPAELLVLRSQIRAICITWILLLALTTAIEALGASPKLPGEADSVFAALGLASLVMQRFIIRTLLIKCFSGRKFARTNIVLITDQPPSKHAGLPNSLATLGFNVDGRFDLPSIGSDSAFRKQLSARVIEHIRMSEIDKIVVESDSERWSALRAFVADLKVLSLPIMFVPVGAGSDLLRHPTRSIGGAVCVELQGGPLTAAERGIKRLVDLIGAAFALTIFSPLLAVAAIAIKLDSSGPVFFKQQRCGFNGRVFSIRKFRTMHVLEDGPVIIQAEPADRRITRVGKWLRRTSLDELPQLLNVFDGTMSLVGPRPHALAHDGQFHELVRNYAFRRRVKPGLTGWAQVHGCRGPTPTAAIIERRVEYDLWYIDNWTLQLDLAILMRTPVEVLRGRNAH